MHFSDYLILLNAIVLFLLEFFRIIYGFPQFTDPS
jgi:hypothetical protein